MLLALLLLLGGGGSFVQGCRWTAARQWPLRYLGAIVAPVGVLATWAALARMLGSDFY